MVFDVALANDIKGYFYIIMGGIIAIFLYGYIYHLYSSKKEGGVDYEKFANIALDDNIDSKPIQEEDNWSKKDKNNTQEK